MKQALLSRVYQKTGEFVELVVAEDIASQVSRRYQKGSVQDTSEDERVFECDTLVVETTVRKIGEISLSGVPQERSPRRWSYAGDRESIMIY